MHSLRITASFLIGSLALCAPVALLAQAPADPSAQLRDALRATTLQLRTAQGDLAAAQATRDQALADLDDLQKRFEALEKKAAADRTTALTNLTNLNSQLAKKDAENARLADRLKTSEDARASAVALAAERDQARAQTAQRLTEAELQIADLRRRNRNLFELGSEILTRYENFGLGRAFVAREPFTKIARVKLQEEVQTLRDTLEEDRAKLPPAPDSTESASTPASE